VLPGTGIDPGDFPVAFAVFVFELGLVAPRDADRPVGSLSVGQRRRLARLRD
jgi:hypothetical protein